MEKEPPAPTHIGVPLYFAVAPETATTPFSWSMKEKTRDAITAIEANIRHARAIAHTIWVD